ncbi:hypothetical protein HWV62_1376 [Athelia sp. TMB]|nr:hypothetical protein HWV62_1376 [Athelia sp. TMB]
MAHSLRDSLTSLNNIQVLSKLGPSLVAIINSLPAVAKYVAIALFLVNFRSWPLMWHLRIFRPVFAVRFGWYWLRIRTLFMSKVAKRKAYETWFESLAPVGKNPLETVITYTSRATIDDCDFNGHLSNSSYAKTFDAARFKAAIHLFASMFSAGGWIALGAQPVILIDVCCQFFIVGRFVSHPKPKGSKIQAKTKPRGSDTPPPTSTANALFQASLRTPADGLQTPATPANPVIAQAHASDMGDATAAMNAIAAAQLGAAEPDGATLNCVVVAQMCFKHGRITVPPGLVLATAGFSAPAPEGAAAYSHANPPPHFAHAKEYISWASSGKFVKLMRGGWRDVPEGERWWVDALGGVVEERRKANVEGLNGSGLQDGPMGLIRRGMEEYHSGRFEDGLIDDMKIDLKRRFANRLRTRFEIRLSSPNDESMRLLWHHAVLPSSSRDRHFIDSPDHVYPQLQRTMTSSTTSTIEAPPPVADEEKAQPRGGDAQPVDPSLVVWYENDEEHPRNWSTAYKSWITFQLGMLTLAANYHETENAALYHPHERMKLDPKTVLTKHLSRPLRMLATEPMVTAIVRPPVRTSPCRPHAAFCASFVHALLYMSSRSSPSFSPRTAAGRSSPARSPSSAASPVLSPASDVEMYYISTFAPMDVVEIPIEADHAGIRAPQLDAQAYYHVRVVESIRESSTRYVQSLRQHVELGLAR